MIVLLFDVDERFAADPAGAVGAEASPLVLALEPGVAVDVSTVYSKLTAVADVGKLANSVKQQHLTRSRPFSLPPQLCEIQIIDCLLLTFKTIKMN